MGFLTPNASGEHAIVKTFALQQLAQMRTTVVGLTDEQAHATPTASALNLTALLLHTGVVGVLWSSMAAAAPGRPEPAAELAGDPAVGASMEQLVADARPLADVLAFFERCVEVTTHNIDAATDLDALVPVPDAPWYPADLKHWEARWCLLHTCTEVARHAGHADIIRETIDGKGSFELNDLAEQRAEA